MDVIAALTAACAGVLADTALIARESAARGLRRLADKLDPHPNPIRVIDAIKIESVGVHPDGLSFQFKVTGEH